MPLTVHGLWPNRERVSVNLQPQYCAGPPLGRLSPALREKLAHVMPGVADGLERYEWRRHGTCSGLTPEAYFSAVVRLAEQADATIGAALRDGGMLGHEMKVDDLIAAVAAKDASLAAAMVVSCRFPREDGGSSRAYVQEIRLVLSKDFSPEPAEHVGFGQNSGCPGKAGFLPGRVCGAVERMLSDRPRWDQARAHAMIGARVLIGLTRSGPEGDRLEQMVGIVASVDPRHGFEIRLQGTRTGEVYWLPPHLDTFKPAQPGQYHLRSSGEVIVDPDFTTTWTVTKDVC